MDEVCLVPFLFNQIFTFFRRKDVDGALIIWHLLYCSWVYVTLRFPPCCRPTYMEKTFMEMPPWTMDTATQPLERLEKLVRCVCGGGGGVRTAGCVLFDSLC
jgi:hypothetical protein